LKRALQELGCVAVAFSGGVDSAFLLKAAHDVLGGRACAVTIKSCVSPERELCEAAAFCAREGIVQHTVEADLLCVPGFSENPPDRCYHCKKALFAGVDGFEHIAEGSNADDDSDYRPGFKAVRELGILSPLRDAGLTKADIRELSRQLGLPTWDKPAFACLATRIPYGEAVTQEKLRMIEAAEEILFTMGLRQVRVRCHESLGSLGLVSTRFAARIETDEAGFEIILARREEVHKRLKAAGFAYSSLDLLGYRMGSLNGGP
jgi:uncharacterized protein